MKKCTYFISYGGMASPVDKCILACYPIPLHNMKTIILTHVYQGTLTLFGSCFSVSSLNVLLSLRQQNDAGFRNHHGCRLNHIGSNNLYHDLICPQFEIEIYISLEIILTNNAMTREVFTKCDEKTDPHVIVIVLFPANKHLLKL